MVSPVSRRPIPFVFLLLLALLLLGSFTACKRAVDFLEGEDIDLDGVPDAKDGDMDGDGLSNQFEIDNLLNPRNADTDGDSWTDKEEMDNYNPASNFIFNPLVADIPSLVVEVVGYPGIALDTTYTESEQIGTSQSWQTAVTEGTTRTYSYGTSLATEHNWEVGLEVAGEISKDPSLTITAHANYGGSITKETNTTWEHSVSKEYSRSYGTELSKITTAEMAVSGGTFSVPVKITNDGHITYRINSLDLVAYKLIPGTICFYDVIGECSVFDASSPTTLDAGSGSGKLNELSAYLYMSEISDLCNNFSGITVDISGYNIDITDALGVTHNFTGSMTDVQSRCTEVIVDYGPPAETGTLKAPLSKLVVTRNKVNPSPTTLEDYIINSTLAEILDIMKVEYTMGEYLGRTGIVAVDGVEHKPEENAFWVVAIQTFATAGVEEDLRFYSVRQGTYDPTMLEIQPRQTVTLFFGRDLDNDGLPSRLETILGSSDLSLDSDADGIRDYDEFFGWYHNNRIFHTDAGDDDTDGDDLLDSEDPNPEMRIFFESVEVEQFLVRSGGTEEAVERQDGTGSTEAYTVLNDFTVSSDSIALVIETVEPVRLVSYCYVDPVGGEGAWLNIEPELDGIRFHQTPTDEGCATKWTIPMSFTDSTPQVYRFTVHADDRRDEETYQITVTSKLGVPDWRVVKLVYGDAEQPYLLHVNWGTLSDSRIEGIIVLEQKNGHANIDAAAPVDGMTFVADQWFDSPTNKVKVLGLYSRGTAIDKRSLDNFGDSYYYKVFSYTNTVDPDYSEDPGTAGVLSITPSRPVSVELTLELTTITCTVDEDAGSNCEVGTTVHLYGPNRSPELKMNIDDWSGLKEFALDTQHLHKPNENVASHTWTIISAVFGTAYNLPIFSIYYWMEEDDITGDDLILETWHNHYFVSGGTADYNLNPSQKYSGTKNYTKSHSGGEGSCTFDFTFSYTVKTVVQ